MTKHTTQAGGDTGKSTPRTPDRRMSRKWRKLRIQVLNRDGWECQIQAPGVCVGKATTVDHIDTYASGGSDHMTNLRAACKPCNYGRHGQPDNPENDEQFEPGPTRW